MDNAWRRVGRYRHRETENSRRQSYGSLCVESKDGEETLHNRDGEFILEPLSESLVKVTHRDQTGYFGMTKRRRQPLYIHCGKVSWER